MVRGRRETTTVLYFFFLYKWGDWIWLSKLQAIKLNPLLHSVWKATLQKWIGATNNWKQQKKKIFSLSCICSHQWFQITPLIRKRNNNENTVMFPKVPWTRLRNSVIFCGPSTAEGSVKFLSNNDSGANCTIPLGSPNFCICKQTKQQQHNQKCRLRYSLAKIIKVFVVVCYRTCIY